MTIDATMVGRSYTAAETYQVGREKIQEFAAAIGDTNPAYHGDDAVAPPTFAFVLSAPALDLLLADPDLGLRLDRIVHGAQKFNYVRPIKAGDEVGATATITTVRKAGDVEVIMYETVLTSGDGEQLVTSTATVTHNRADA